MSGHLSGSPIEEISITAAIAERPEVELEKWRQAEEAVRQIPLYQKLYRDLGQSDELFESKFARLPILERDHLSNAFPELWESPATKKAVSRGALEYATTSGSSGERVHLFRPQGWWLAEHKRCFPLIRGLSTFKVGISRKVSLTTLDCSASSCSLEFSTPEDRTMNQVLYINTCRTPDQWNRAELDRMASEWKAHEPDLVDADPILLALFIERCHQHGLELPAVPPVLSLDYELVTSWARAIISEAFPCPIVNLHGSTELGCLFAESDGKWTPIQPLCHIEAIPFCPSRNTWQLRVTSVKNPLMPFIRYDVGDIVKLSSAGQVELICGRAQECLIDRNGVPVSPGELDALLGEIPAPISVYQLAVGRHEQIEFRYVSRYDQAVCESEIAALHDRLHSLLGEKYTIKFSPMREIRPKASGKFALVEHLKN